MMSREPSDTPKNPFLCKIAHTVKRTPWYSNEPLGLLELAKEPLLVRVHTNII